jgi:class 3 adenylate cyclase
MTPETRFARSGDVDIAYQVVGSGAIDILVTIPWVSHIEFLWELPEAARFVRGLATLGRVILFNRRGVGLSDRGDASATAAEMAADVIAVLDAAGSEQAVLFGWLDSASLNVVVAALHPDRVSGLVLGEVIEWLGDDADADALSDLLDRLAAAIEDGAWGQGIAFPLIAPTASQDERVVAWWRRWERISATPNTAARLLREITTTDIRPYLDDVRAPTLVLHRTESMLPEEPIRNVAERLADGRYVAIPGTDLAAFLSDDGYVLEAVETFLQGTTSGGDANRAVLTLLFTDLVDSTGRIAAVGDTAWQHIVATHRTEVRRQLALHNGTEVDTAGDGFFATFVLPSRALRCAAEINAVCVGLDLPVRTAIHAGEVVVTAEGVVGMSVHAAARMMALADPGEVVCSGTVADLLAGTRVSLEPKGEHELRGVPGTWGIHRLVPDI